jgi:LysM repeat protein
MQKLLIAIVLAAVLSTTVAPAFADTVYVVQPGDTLFKISLKFNVSMQAIVTANGITNPNIIFAGQRLIIPSGGSTGTSGSGQRYTVQRGDTLFVISLRFGVTIQAIMAANGITNANLIFAGQVLTIPGSGSNVTPVPTSPPPATATPPPSSGVTYVVQSGDTLWSIARKFGVSQQAIMTANGLTNPNLIFAGQTLTIPGVSGTPVPTATATPSPGATATPSPTITAPSTTPGLWELGGQVSDFSVPDKMKFAGMTWVKRQVRWAPGLTASADQITEAHNKGFKILLSVVGDPGDIFNGANYDAYAAYVGELARLGADGIEVWNEMNIDREWPAGQINPTTYVDLLRRAYNAIKAKNANTLVISGAPAPTGAEGAFGLDHVWNDDRYVKGMAGAGAANYMDCIGVHYNEGILSPTLSSGDPRNPSDFYSRYYPAMVSLYYNAFGGTKKLCFTELGYLSPEGYGTLPIAFGWASGTTVAQQAQWLGEAANLSKNGGLVRLMIVFNMDFKDFGADPQAGYAIIRLGGTCPACDSLRQVTGGR